jgi:hypothetical protein
MERARLRSAPTPEETELLERMHGDGGGEYRLCDEPIQLRGGEVRAGSQSVVSARPQAKTKEGLGRELRTRRERLAELRVQTLADQAPRTGPSHWFLLDKEPAEGWTYGNVQVELRHTVAPDRRAVCVRLGRGVWRFIADLAEAFQGDAGVECLGALYARPGSPFLREMLITEASEVGRDRSETSVRARLEDLHADERKRRDGDIRSIGSWHTRPSSLSPSPADLATWRHMHHHAEARHRATRQIHLILAPSSARGWRRPDVAAYALRIEHDTLGRRYICEPAAIDRR